MDKQYMRTKDVARYLAVTEQTVRKWANAGEIPSRKIGHTIVFVKEEIDSCLASKEGNAK